ncbi:MAG: hypothetical protein QM755_07265 [Luteolibacter sp.]
MSIEARANGYDTWISGYPGLGDASPNADPDHDGIPNGIEFVLGTDPSVADAPAVLPQMEFIQIQTHGTVPIGNYVKMTWRRADRSNELNPGIEISTNLSHWRPAAGGNEGIVVREYAEGYGAFLDKVEVYIPTSLAVNGRLFARLKLPSPQA